MLNFSCRIIFYITIFYIALFLFALFFNNTFKYFFENPINVILESVAYYNLEKLPYHPWFFLEERTQDKGIVKYIPEKSWGKYILFSKADSHKALLMNRNGEIVKAWDADFKKIWPDPPHINPWARDKHITLSRVFYSTEGNGDIYVMFFGPSFMYEYGLAKLDKDSNVLWTFDDHAHHDVAQLSNGKILTLLATLNKNADERLLNVKSPYIEEFLLVLDRDGKEEKRISINEAFMNSDFSEFLKNLQGQHYDKDMRYGDLLHPNTITLIPDDLIGSKPWFKKNSVLLSFRNTDMLAILDIDTQKILWATLGPWRGQHSPRFTNDSKVVLFDNYGSLRDGGFSRIIEVDLDTLEVVWAYEGSREKPFYSPYNSMVEPLYNGNFLVTETHAGRIFEISRNKEIVWEYYVPERYEFKQKRRIPSVFSAKAFSELGF